MERYSPTDDFLARLIDYSWPGNVRELRNVLERVMVLSKDGILSSDLLPVEIFNPTKADVESEVEERPEHAPSREELIGFLRQADYNVSKVARILHYNRRTVHRWMKKYGIAERQ